MKRFVFILAFLCPAGAVALLAQHNSFFVGANGGVNLSHYKFTEDLSELYPVSNSRLGLNGGFDMGMEIDNFTISTGLHYIQKGGEYQTDNFENSEGVGFFSGREKVHYLSIPIMLGYRKYLGNELGLTFAIGPSINMGLAGKIDEEIEYFGSDRIDIENYKVEFGSGVNDDYRSTQVGFRISPGLIFPLNHRSKLTFNVTWDLGTGDIFNPRYKDANDFFLDNKGDQVNRSTLFTLGYEYHIPFGDKY